MAVTAVAEVDSILQSMLNLKPPGISSSKVTALTTLCTANIKQEVQLLTKIYSHFKKTRATHKLGVLYVVDSVTRQWVDQARKAGQTSSSDAPEGTFGAGLHRMTEMLPSLMNDILNNAPEDQKPKIRKLVEIWERSGTFPAEMLSSFKTQLDEAKPVQSTTPTTSPPPGFIPIGQQNQTTPAPPQQNASSVLEALSRLAQQSQTQAQAPAVISAPNTLNGLAGLFGSVPQNNTPVNGSAVQQAVNPLASLFPNMSASTSTPLPQIQQATTMPPNPLAALFPQQLQSAPQSAIPAPLPPPSSNDPHAQATLQLVQLMAAKGIPPEQWATGIAMLQAQQAQKTGAPLPLPNQSFQPQLRSPPRQRSRSPTILSPQANNYRVRSPQRRSFTPEISNYQSLPPPQVPRAIEFDPALPKDTIKVKSRTLFVGGVTSSEAHLRSLFTPHGPVQTCIVNIDKRHAFVKMLSRSSAELARSAMETAVDPRDGTQLRTKWGVGFGPRDCSDYQTGVSVIPMGRLTDADRKWLVSKDGYGGTGGVALTGGMVVEEPDIEIGQGVSSKAMSKRIATDMGGVRGPVSSNRDDEPRGSNARDRSDRDRGRRGRDRDHDRYRPNGGTATGNPNNMPVGQRSNGLANMGGTGEIGQNGAGSTGLPGIPGMGAGNAVGMPDFSQFMQNMDFSKMPMGPSGVPMMPPGFPMFAGMQGMPLMNGGMGQNGNDSGVPPLGGAPGTERRE